MSAADPIHLDALIFGGGAAGLWLLDELHRAGYQALLLESGSLGAGQTVASQGIIHGGLKYTLKGMFNPSADAIREMPLLWRHCLEGDARPHLGGTTVRAQFCHLWRTDSLQSKLGMFGATKALRVAPVKLDRNHWPAALHGCPGDVYRLDEQVISPQSLITDLHHQNRFRVLQYWPDQMTSTAEPDNPPAVRSVTLTEPVHGDSLTLLPRAVVLTAGEGNHHLHERFGLNQQVMQRRPLHMVMVRGQHLPELNGHCTDGSATRVTITSDTDAQGRRVWQVGGAISEVGVQMERDQLIAHARNELAQVLPGVDFSRVEWSTYRVNRAELATAGGLRPEDAAVLQQGNVITGWPTKLALVPRLSRMIRSMLAAAGLCPAADVGRWRQWPRPKVALPPWELEAQWSSAH